MASPRLQTEADLGRKVRGSKLEANPTLAKLDPLRDYVNWDSHYQKTFENIH